MKSDDVLVLHPLQEDHLIVNHLFIALDILFQDDLDRESLAVHLCLPNYAICASPQRPTESILCSVGFVSPTRPIARLRRHTFCHNCQVDQITCSSYSRLPEGFVSRASLSDACSRTFERSNSRMSALYVMCVAHGG